TYEGEWVAGVIEGEGKATYANGAIYEGSFKNAKNDGQGVMTSPEGYRYEGGWKDSLRHGEAKVTYADGSVYEGEFANG
ncbi:2-isopropylmalate synthase, partial [Limimaricola sp. G21655-S1]|nr:2-isopropylmalate synthase [Limimaricola sp. G21655-S1]